jgi:hypothetical protein
MSHRCFRPPPLLGDVAYGAGIEHDHALLLREDFAFRLIHRCLSYRILVVGNALASGRVRNRRWWCEPGGLLRCERRPDMVVRRLRRQQPAEVIQKSHCSPHAPFRCAVPDRPMGEIWKTRSSQPAVGEIAPQLLLEVVELLFSGRDACLPADQLVMHQRVAQFEQCIDRFERFHVAIEDRPVEQFQGPVVLHEHRFADGARDFWSKFLDVMDDPPTQNLT